MRRGSILLGSTPRCDPSSAAQVAVRCSGESWTFAQLGGGADLSLLYIVPKSVLYTLCSVNCVNDCSCHDLVSLSSGYTLSVLFEVAVRCAGESWTFKQLAAYARTVAAQLRSPQGSVVAVLADRGCALYLQPPEIQMAR